MTRQEAITTLRAANEEEDTLADALANVTDDELAHILRTRDHGHAPRNPGALQARDLKVRIAWTTAGG